MATDVDAGVLLISVAAAGHYAHAVASGRAEQFSREDWQDFQAHLQQLDSNADFLKSHGNQETNWAGLVEALPELMHAVGAAARSEALGATLVPSARRLVDAFEPQPLAAPFRSSALHTG